MEPIYVIKNSGERELFSQQKVLDSMQRVGVSESLRPEILHQIQEKLYPEIKTSQIYSQIVNSLENKDTKSSLKFNLKQAIFDFGPTGFPFEKYLGRIFESMGYKVATDVVLEGECVTHEVDLLLEKDGKKEIMEAKFHNQSGVRTDMHVALYTYARFLDLKERHNLTGAWIATNTKLSKDAISYCECKKMKVVGWNFPEGANLKDLIEKPSLYPVTILNILNREEKVRLIENGTVLCCDLLKTPHEKLEKDLSINKDRLNRAIKESQVVCGFAASGSSADISGNFQQTND